MTRTLLHAQRTPRDLGVLTAGQQAAKLVPMQRFFPALMRLPLVIAFPLEVRRVAKAAREITQKLPPRALRGRRPPNESLHTSNFEPSRRAGPIAGEYGGVVSRHRKDETRR